MSNLHALLLDLRPWSLIQERFVFHYKIFSYEFITLPQTTLAFHQEGTQVGWPSAAGWRRSLTSFLSHRTGCMNASCAPAAAPAAPATGGMETSTWGLQFSCRCGVPCLKQPEVLEDSGLLGTATCRGCCPVPCSTLGNPVHWVHGAFRESEASPGRAFVVGRATPKGGTQCELDPWTVGSMHGRGVLRGSGSLEGRNTLGKRKG